MPISPIPPNWRRADADDHLFARDTERFVVEMPVALTDRRSLAVELRWVLEQENGTTWASVDGPAKEEEVLHDATVREAELPKPDVPPGKQKLRR
jgi:hypothetical protein